MSKPDWDTYFLDIARAVSKRGDCRRRLVGAVLVDDENRIIATGYNGVKPKEPGCLDGACPRGLLSTDEVAGLSDYTGKGYCISTHAEINAMLYARTNLTKATMYITDPPCETCSKIMKNSGIKRVVHL